MLYQLSYGPMSYGALRTGYGVKTVDAFRRTPYAVLGLNRMNFRFFVLQSFIKLLDELIRELLDLFL